MLPVAFEITSANAVVIAAGIAVGGGLLGQFFVHRFTARRDQESERSEREYKAVVGAAQALQAAGRSRESRADNLAEAQSDPKEMWAAQAVDQIGGYIRDVFRAGVLLELNFGPKDPLVEQFRRTAVRTIHALATEDVGHRKAAGKAASEAERAWMKAASVKIRRGRR